MTKLQHEHLMTLAFAVDFAGVTEIGETPAGIRRIAPITGGHFSGERLNGTVLPGTDWAIARPDGAIIIDVRLPLQTNDGPIIYLTYQGRFLASPEAMERFRTGALLKPEEYSMAMTAKFECGDTRYRWLNDVVAVGTGQQTVEGPIYSIFAIG